MKASSQVAIGLAIFDILMNLLLSNHNAYIIELLKLKGLDQGVAYIVEVKWSDESDADIDVYVRDPYGSFVCYSQLRMGFMHLDQDDRGIITDEVVGPNGEVRVLRKNREEVSIRQFIPGLYVVNVHMYAGREPTKVTVNIYDGRSGDTIKMLTRDVVLKTVGEDTTAFQFRLNEEGMLMETSFRYVPLEQIWRPK